jgi:hypothetical protein
MNLMTSVSGILVLLALVFLIMAILGKLPLWPAVLCLVLERMVTLVPR